MFCPECGGEYRPGFTMCADCEVPLVEHLAGDVDGAPQAGPGGDPEAGGLVLLTVLNGHHFAAALADRFEAEDIGYVLQYGSAMEEIGGRQLVTGRRAVARSSWHGLCWVTPGDLARARDLAREAAEELARELDSVPFELPDED